MATQFEHGGGACSTPTPDPPKTASPFIGPQLPARPQPPPSAPPQDSPGPVQAVSSTTSLSSGDQDHSRTIYVGNLGIEVTSNYVFHLFSPYGIIKSWKIIREGNRGAIAFIEFDNPNSAERAIGNMDKRTVMNRVIRVNWADHPVKTNMDSSDSLDVTTKAGFTVFVGDTGNLEEHDLSEPFGRYGRILKVNVKRDRVSGRSKHFAFITYAEESAAADAIREMNGAWVKNRTLRVNWANNSMHGSQGQMSMEESDRQMSYFKISKEASLQNTTIFCGYLKGILTEELLRNEFSQYGVITDVKCCSEKGYGFVRFQNRSSAINAILEKNGTPFSGENNGTMMKVSWGKEITSYDNFSAMGNWANPNPWNTNSGNYGYGYHGYYTRANSAGSPASSYSAAGGGRGLSRRYNGRQYHGSSSNAGTGTTDYGYSLNQNPGWGSYPTSYPNTFGYQNMPYSPYGYGYLCSAAALQQHQPQNQGQAMRQQPPPGFPVQSSSSSLLGPVPGTTAATTLPYTATMGEAKKEPGSFYYSNGNKEY